MLSAGYPARVEFGRIGYVAAGIKVMVHELHRPFTTNGSAKIVGSEHQGRSVEVRFRDVYLLHR